MCDNAKTDAWPTPLRDPMNGASETRAKQSMSSVRARIHQRLQLAECQERSARDDADGLKAALVLLDAAPETERLFDALAKARVI